MHTTAAARRADILRAEEHPAIAAERAVEADPPATAAADTVRVAATPVVVTAAVVDTVVAADTATDVN
jgi:hypothetical protein